MHQQIVPIILSVLLIFLIKSSFEAKLLSRSVNEDSSTSGFWQAKTQWKAHWVKHWEIRKVWVPIWRKVWGPVEVKEWVPLPKPNPTWTAQK